MGSHDGELSEISYMKVRIKIIFLSVDEHAHYSTSIPSLFSTILSESRILTHSHYLVTCRFQSLWEVCISILLMCHKNYSGIKKYAMRK